MSKTDLGFALYLEIFDQAKNWLGQFSGQGRLVFTSLQRQEEWSPNYKDQVRDMLDWLAGKDFYVIADVSPRSLEWLGCENLNDLVAKYPINNLRIDDGFGPQDLDGLGGYDLTLNASTQVGHIQEWCDKAKTYDISLFAMHNYYPRPETGLDFEQVIKINQVFNRHEIPVMAFISGDKQKRGPLYQGLPTLEECRHLSPVLAFALMTCVFCQTVIVSETWLTDDSLTAIGRVIHDKVVPVPCDLLSPYQALCGKVISFRPDSPTKLLRSSTFRSKLDPEFLTPMPVTSREVGDITLDSLGYGPYAGELQILRQAMPADPKINVIGHLTCPVDLVDRLAKAGYRVVLGMGDASS